MSLEKQKIPMSEEEQDAHWKRMMGGMDVARHLEDLIKARKLIIVGDDSHSTVRSMKAVYANIDAPREYDFQDINVNEQSALNYIQFWNSFMMPCNADAVIAGAPVTGKVKDRVCDDCNHELAMTLEGNTLTITGDGPCQSNAAFDVKLHFPTGEVIAGDFPVGFHKWYHHPLHKKRMADTYTPGLAGLRESTERWQKENVGHFFVGNTCPNVKLAKGGVISIRPDEKDETGRKLTNICTDLWWATLVDEQTWRAMMQSIGALEPEIASMLDAAEKFKVKPGTYVFRCEMNAGEGGNFRRFTGTRIIE